MFFDCFIKLTDALFLYGEMVKNVTLFWWEGKPLDPWRAHNKVRNGRQSLLQELLN